MPTARGEGYDQVSNWLEEHIRPNLLGARREFIREYLRLFSEWSRFHAQAARIEDQESLSRFVERAEQALREIASGKPARLWLSVVRSLPLQVVALITGVSDTQELGGLVKVASAAACRYGDLHPGMTEGRNGLGVTLEWLESFKQNLPVDVPRFFGAAHAWQCARMAYRAAGKGARLKEPPTIDAEECRVALDGLRADAIMIVPSVEFSNYDEIAPSLDEYDRRSLTAGAAGITGLLFDSGAPIVGEAVVPTWWHVVGWSPEHSLSARIYYPRQDLTLTTISYWPIAVELSAHLAPLVPFAGLMPERLGMRFDGFRACCAAVGATLHYQTGIGNLELLSKSDGAWWFRAEHPTIESEVLSASFLFSVMHRGYLRAPTRSWRNALTELVAKEGLGDAEQLVEVFLSRFTRVSTLDADLEPSLFVPTDTETLVLDLLIAGEFFDFCLRKLTTIDDSPLKTARRGAQFEQAAWEYLSQKLSVDLAVDLNKRLRAGAVRGEIDIAFFVRDVLVVLECKSWQKTLGYFRGDRSAVLRRQEELRRVVEGQIPRNVELLVDHLKLQTSMDVVSFVCVAGPEFVMREYEGLWFGGTPRVLTPEQLVSLISDQRRWTEVLSSARAKLR
jgi:hypothetical protein